MHSFFLTNNTILLFMELNNCMWHPVFKRTQAFISFILLQYLACI